MAGLERIKLPTALLSISAASMLLVASLNRLVAEADQTTFQQVTNLEPEKVYVLNRGSNLALLAMCRLAKNTPAGLFRGFFNNEVNLPIYRDTLVISANADNQRFYQDHSSQVLLDSSLYQLEPGLFLAKARSSQIVNGPPFRVEMVEEIFSQFSCTGIKHTAELGLLSGYK